MTPGGSSSRGRRVIELSPNGRRRQENAWGGRCARVRQLRVRPCLQAAALTDDVAIG